MLALHRDRESLAPNGLFSFRGREWPKRRAEERSGVAEAASQRTQLKLESGEGRGEREGRREEEREGAQGASTTHGSNNAIDDDEDDGDGEDGEGESIWQAEAVEAAAGWARVEDDGGDGREVDRH